MQIEYNCLFIITSFPGMQICTKHVFLKNNFYMNKCFFCQIEGKKRLFSVEENGFCLNTRKRARLVTQVVA